MRRAWLGLATALTVLALPSRGRAERSLVATRVSGGAVRIDGHLDESAWREAVPSGGFVERRPVTGATPPVATEVRVLYDDEAVYVGVTMALMPDETPRAFVMTRDDDSIWDDDAVTVKFDVARDRRSTVGFAVNPAGAQLDFLALDGGRSFRLEYDASWECGTSVTASEWVAELRLPFVALGLSASSRARILGLQVSRDHSAARATYDWSAMPPEFGPFSARHYGALEGVRTSSGGRPLTLVPYVLFSDPATSGAQVRGFQAGGDLHFRLAPDFWSELTLLTDFAQADIDDQVTNLSRFPLQLPEKRQFFLSGLDAFDFGHPQTSSAQLFFSRRIGLDDQGRQVPILGGMKHYGRLGPVTVGVLDVVTLATADLPAANWAVARVSNEVAPGIEVGAIGTLRQDASSLGTADDPGVSVPTNVAGGVDGAIEAADGRLQMQGFAAGSSGPSDGAAGRLNVAWKGVHLQPALTGLLVSDDFDPALGFVRRSGVTILQLDMPYVIRAPTTWLDEVGWNTGASIIASDEIDTVLGRNVDPDFWVTLRSGWSLDLGAEFTEDVVEDEFELVPGIRIQPRTYQGGDGFASLSSPASQNPAASLLYVTGNALYDGWFHKWKGSFSVSLTGHFRFAAGAEIWSISLPGEKTFWTETVNAHATVAVSTTLFTDVIVGGNSVERTGVAYLRVRWRYRPGSDVFLVYREDLSLHGQVTSERSLVLKVSARFDAVL
jgi:uncharacterized protein DUF5916